MKRETVKPDVKSLNESFYQTGVRTGLTYEERVLLNGIGIQSIYSFKYFPAFITGIELRTLLKSKIQLDSLKEIGLTDEQKLYLELVEGENNNE